MREFSLIPYLLELYRLNLSCDLAFYVRSQAYCPNMGPTHLTLRLTNLPSDITKPRLENQIRPIAQNRNCNLSVGPIVKVDNAASPRSALTTITVRGDGRAKVVEDLRRLLVGSLTEQREAHADTTFYGPTVLAANQDSFLE